MDTFYEPLLELEAFGQIREQLKKEEGLQLKRLACEIDPYL